MRPPQTRTLTLLLVTAFLGTAATAHADTLTLRDGRRVEGFLVGVRGDTIEFEVREGRQSGRVVRYDRQEIRSIDFDDWRDGDRGYRPDRWSRAGVRERTVHVDARRSWIDTGVTVRAGQEIMFVADGTIRWGPGRKDGPAGERNSPYNSLRPMPDYSAAALIGKIDEDGDPFFIGDLREPIRVRASGRLFLGINDDHVADNSGSLRVVIRY